MSAYNTVPDKPARPAHIAIVMDGNGRWAMQRGMARLEGHRKGAEVVREITTFARELEIPYLTLFSFSRQNWRRPPAEVAGLMQLLADYCGRERKTLMENDIRLATIGELSRLPGPTRQAVEELVEDSTGNRSMTLTLAVDYGGREEIVAAVRRLAQDVRRKRIAPESIDESLIEAHLDTALLPDPDLIIRTSGEMRISNFLLWQLAYTELYFTEVRWPDFTRAHFAEALWAYASRERRFGGAGDRAADGGVGGVQLPGQRDVDDEAYVLGDLPETEPLSGFLTAEKGTKAC
jgi:undecaprenyl diphosphate synthase